MLTQPHLPRVRRARRASVLLLVTGTLVAAALTILSMAGGGVAAARATAQNCTLKNLIATVRLGPDKGFVLAGTAKLQIDRSGSISGSLAQRKGAPAKVVGQANGRAINLVFSLADGRNVFSTGTLINDIRACKGLMRGPVVGPRQGDIGDWAGIGVRVR